MGDHKKGRSKALKIAVGVSGNNLYSFELRLKSSVKFTRFL